MKQSPQKKKIEWVLKNCYAKGKSRPQAIQMLIKRYGCSYNYAHTIIYNLIGAQQRIQGEKWERAPYPIRCKPAKKKLEEIDTTLKDKLKVKHPARPVDADIAF